MKKVVVILVLFLFFTGKVYADEYSLISEYVYVYTEEIEGVLDYDLIGETMPEFSVEDFVSKTVKGENVFDFQGLRERFKEIFFKEIRWISGSLAVVLLLVILSSLISNLSLIKDGGAEKTALIIGKILIGGTLSVLFVSLAKTAMNVINTVTYFMETLVPSMVVCLTASGLVTSSATIQPLILAVSGGIAIACKTILFPMASVFFLLNIFGNLSDGFSVKKTPETIKKLFKMFLEILFIVFTAIISIQGFALSVTQGISFKAAKFLTGNLVPVVGGVISESLESVVYCNQVIKGSLGIIGIVVIILYLLSPVIKLVLASVLFRILSALTEPVSDEKTVKIISGFCDSLSMITAILVSVSFVFIIALTILIRLGNFL